RVTSDQASGVGTIDVDADQLPLTVGRSRNQAVVVDRQHESVSGHHLDIVGIEGDGVQVVVHGDNGVLVAGYSRMPGSRFAWHAGECMVLDHAPDESPACSLRLTRGGSDA
ncbi:MAG: FHA domain-containing protein, partial [Rubrivivax sp.]